MFACTAALLQNPIDDYDDPVNSAHSCQLPDGHVNNCQFRCCRGGWKQITLRLRRSCSNADEQPTADVRCRSGTEQLKHLYQEQIRAEEMSADPKEHYEMI
jgi:hypothetical protein